MNNQYSNSCGCENTVVEPILYHKHGKSLAMAYVPWQTWQHVMDGCNGLKHGSIFEELILPFEGTRAACSFHKHQDNKEVHYNNYNRRGMR